CIILSLWKRCRRSLALDAALRVNSLIREPEKLCSMPIQKIQSLIMIVMSTIRKRRFSFLSHYLFLTC
ncbi:Oxygen-independent coproporphyrinogen-III oxidase-like protein HemZ, partial [Bacillus altitudinis]